jgi:hypothetical protein
LARSLNYQIEQLEGGIVRPVRIFYHQEDWSLACVALELIKQRSERSATLLRGAER